MFSANAANYNIEFWDSICWLPLTYPHKNPQPLSRVGVFWGSENPDLYPHPPYPYPCTPKGLQTLAHHYQWLATHPACLGTKWDRSAHNDMRKGDCHSACPWLQLGHRLLQTKWQMYLWWWWWWSSCLWIWRHGHAYCHPVGSQPWGKCYK